MTNYLKSKAVGLLKQYWICVFIFLLFFWMRRSSPLTLDMLNGSLVYRDYGGFFNYLTGYMFSWVMNVNTRFFAGLIGGVLESNKLLIDFVTAGVIAGFVGSIIWIFNVRKNFIVAVIAGALVLIIDNGIHSEVFMYASFLFVAPAIMFLWIVKFWENFIAMPSQKNIKLYYVVLVICSMWLETVSLGLLVATIVFFAYFLLFLKERRKQCIRLFLISIFISLSGFFFMLYPRFAMANIGSEGDSEAVWRRIYLLTMSVFENNSILLGLLTLLSIIIVYKKVSQWALKIPHLIFTGYMLLVFIYNAYNVHIREMQMRNTASHLLENTMLPVLEVAWLEFPSSELVALIMYSLLAISFLLPVFLVSSRQILLPVYGAAGAVFVSLIFSTEHFGARISSFVVFLLSAVCIGFAIEVFDIELPNLKKSKVLIIASLVLLILPTETHLINYSHVNEIRLINEQLKENARITQIEGRWCFDTDVLAIVAIEEDLLFRPNPGSVAHFPHWLRVHRLHPNTDVVVVQRFW